MAGEDGSVRIDTKIDQAGLDKGLSEVGKKLKDGAKVVDGYLGKVAKVSLAATGAGLALKKIADTVTDLTDAYKTQYRAETQLEQAAKNNPYLNDLAVQQLKDYASSMQQLAGVGDEQLIPLMAQLAGAGRSQADIQDILRVSLDWAATGAISLDGAVKNLNKSYGGLAGELGESIPEVRALTAEQLRQGGAVKLLGDRYKGMAEEVTKNVGSSAKLANAFGDLKEQIGRPFEEGLAPVRGFFTGILTGWTNSLAKLNEYRKAQKELHDDPNDANAQLIVQKKLLSDIDKEYTGVARLAYSESQAYGMVSKTLRDQIDELLKKREAQAAVVSGLEVQIRKEQELAAEEQKSANAAADVASKNSAAADYIAKVTTAREKAIEQIRLQAQAEGEEADQLDIINAYVSSYVSLVSESGGLVTANNRAARELLATTQEMVTAYDEYLARQAKDKEQKDALKERAESLRASMRDALSSIQKEDDRALSEQMKGRLEALDSMYAELMGNEQSSSDQLISIWEEYTDKRKTLAEQISEAEKAEADEAAEHREERYLAMLNTANEFAAQYALIMSSLQQLASQYIDDRASADVAAVEESYAAGEISAEEYEDKLNGIKKKAAEEKYRLDMWAWSSNILSAVSNTALAATRALAEGGPFTGPLLAAMITAAGGVQLASILANKPIPPSFATGGIVGGSSYTGDEVLARVNSGEMLLNAGQQRNLFDQINSGDLGGDGRIQVNNFAANDVKVEPEITERGMVLAIRRTVAKDMADGRFNKPYRTMQNNLRGTRYTS